MCITAGCLKPSDDGCAAFMSFVMCSFLSTGCFPALLLFKAPELMEEQALWDKFTIFPFAKRSDAVVLWNLLGSKLFSEMTKQAW